MIVWNGICIGILAYVIWELGRQTLKKESDKKESIKEPKEPLFSPFPLEKLDDIVQMEKLEKEQQKVLDNILHPLADQLVSQTKIIGSKPLKKKNVRQLTKKINQIDIKSFYKD